MKNNKWLFACLIAVIALLTIGIIYQFVKIKELEHKVADYQVSAVVVLDKNITYPTM